MIKFLVQDKFDYTGNLRKALNQTNTPYISLTPLHFLEVEPVSVDKNDVIIPYCSLQYYKLLKKAPNVVVPDLRNFNCSFYYKSLRKELLNYEVSIFLPFGMIEDFLDSIKIGEKVFIRPNSSGKEFTGFVHEVGKKISVNAPHSLFCLIAPYKEITNERRYIVSSLGATGGSTYSVDREEKNIDSPEKIIDNIVKNMRFHPHPFFTVDLCDYEGETKVVEINSFNFAGLYETSVETLVKTINMIKNMEVYLKTIKNKG